MQGLLHMLLFTRGNAIIIIDNSNVVNTFFKGVRARPQFHGILWSAIFKEARVRSELGFGYLKPIWIRSHLQFDVAIKQETDPCIGLLLNLPTMLRHELQL